MGNIYMSKINTEQFRFSNGFLLTYRTSGANRFWPPGVGEPGNSFLGAQEGL